jgi:hypothetical protein
MNFEKREPIEMTLLIAERVSGAFNMPANGMATQPAEKFYEEERCVPEKIGWR